MGMRLGGMGRMGLVLGSAGETAFLMVPRGCKWVWLRRGFLDAGRLEGGGCPLRESVPQEH